MKQFSKTVSTAGTPERLVAATEDDFDDYQFKVVIIQASNANTGVVAIGESDVDANSSPVVGIRLAAGESLALDDLGKQGMWDLREFWIDTTVNGEGVEVLGQ